MITDTSRDAEIFPQVRDVIAESLAVDAAQVLPSASLIAELGATSLDFVDILFLLEERFGIRLQNETFNFVQRLDLPEAEVLNDGVFTAAAKTRLRAWLPELPLDRELGPAEIFPYVTPTTICRIVAQRLC